eukprot:gene25957-32513_t
MADGAGGHGHGRADVARRTAGHDGAWAGGAADRPFSGHGDPCTGGGIALSGDRSRHADAQPARRSAAAPSGGNGWHGNVESALVWRPDPAPRPGSGRLCDDAGRMRGHGRARTARPGSVADRPGAAGNDRGYHRPASGVVAVGGAAGAAAGAAR